MSPISSGSPRLPLRTSCTSWDGDPLSGEEAWRAYLEQARWFGGKGRQYRIASLTPLPWYTALPTWPALRSELAVIDYGDGQTETYHLLAGYRRIGSAAAAPSIGRVVLPELGEVELFEIATDAEARAAFVAALVEQAPAGMNWLDHSWFNSSDQVGLFSGEQSNSNLLIGDRALLKVFRRLEPGPNLDAEVLAALNGSLLTPALYGTLSHQGTDLAMVSELVPAAGDGWSLATSACAAGADFTEAAAELGTALRSLHLHLAEAYPVAVSAGAEIAAQMQRRLASALAEAPVLVPYAEALQGAFDQLNGAEVAVQQIHRDFHLGQVLRRRAGGWAIIDFEGEPLTSAAERRRPDSVWRDVAGALRSFDYARSAHQAPDSDSVRQWSRDARQAFLAAYLGSDQLPIQVLRAYELDKAVYEVRYELRNRPEWAHIPLRSVQDELTEPPSGPSVPKQGVAMAHDPAGGLTGWDLEGFHNGGDTECWRRLGAHEMTVFDDARGEVQGTRFAVWAPNAREVRLNADFNWWTGDAMQLVPGSGIWALFVEGVGAGTLYKFNILGADGTWREKVDPVAFFAEMAPANSSIVYTSKFVWGDDEWLSRRAQTRPHAEPMSIYEVHLSSWRKGKTYLELADELVEYVTWQGFTHVEFMPVTEHPFEPSWGYQVTNYFAPQSRLGRPDEFRYLVDRLHQAGIGVILDWVPGHFPKDEWALGRFDGTALYEHADPRQGEHKEWGTYIFNYGRNEVKSFLVSNALYWVTEFHIDALRVDAVASMLYLDYSREEGEWVPNIHGGRENLDAIDFLRYVNKHLYERVPGVVMIAEESTSFPGVTKPVHEGGLGFGFKWNMGWMNDSLRYLALEPIYRQYHHNDMTFAMVYAHSENFVLPISHDEVVHGKGSMINKVPQDTWRQFATLRAFYSFMWAFPGKKLIFAGCEFGQRSEFNEAVSLEWWVSELWGHHGLQRMFKDLNEIYRAHPAFWELDSSPDGFRWINADDAGANTFSWVRTDAEGRHLAAVVNFSSEPWTAYRIGLPATGAWTEIYNSDAGVYDGTDNFGNLGQVTATAEGWNGLPASATIVVPPLGAVYFAHAPEQH